MTKVPWADAVPDDPDAEVERRLRHERRVAEELDLLRIRDEARRRLAVETRGVIGPPEVLTLRERLGRPRPPKRWRIRDWQPDQSRVMLAAAFKAGKTTFAGNAARCLVDGDLWLGRYDVNPIDGNLAIVDLEMSADQLDGWLGDQKIRNDDRIIVVPMRGRAAGFNIMDDQLLARWAKILRDQGVTYLILDCVRPVLDALGLSEDKEAGFFLTRLDALLVEASVPDALVIHHMGHSGERSRGDSRLRDWPDVEWRLVREDADDPHSMRYVSAYGRDVDIPESQVVYNAATRQMTLAGGSRRDAKARVALGAVLDVLRSAEEKLAGNAIERALQGTEHTRAAVRAAVQLGIRTGAVVTEPGPRGAIHHGLAETGQTTAPATSPNHTQTITDTAPYPTGDEPAGHTPSTPSRRSSPHHAGEPETSAPAPLYKGAHSSAVSENEP